MTSKQREIEKIKQEIIDPTENVLKHVEGAVKRLDDIQQANGTRLSEIICLNVKRIDDLRVAESRRVDEEAIMRAEFAEKLRDAEAKRIDVIRAVDVNAVAVASERANAQAAVLADQLAKSNESNRSLVQLIQTAFSTQLDAITKTFNERVGIVEKAQYENKGKTGVTDPIYTELLQEVKALKTSGATHSG
jgi:hypothetical protein